MTPGRRGDGRAARSATSRHRATWGIERGEWKDLGEVSRGQQSISFIHEGHERHEEKILRKIGMDSLPLPDGRCGAVVMGYPCEQARGYPITTAPPPTGVQACPCRKSLRVKLPSGHKIEHTAHIVHRYRLQYFMRSAQFYAKRFSSWAGLTPKVWVCGTGVGRASLLARDPPQCHRPIAP
jgi:hypothetical protein